MKRQIRLLIVLVALIVPGFATISSGQDVKKYGSAAYAAARAGDWRTARENWAKAIASAESTGAPAQQLAVLNYEYGRSLGVQCFWDESEKYLLKAFEFDHQTGGDEFMSLVELSRLKHDQKQYDKATVYFERAVAALEKASAPTKAPVGFAEILDEYATALKSAGRGVEATAVQNRAQKLRTDNPKGYSITDRTPYGTQCVKEK